MLKVENVQFVNHGRDSILKVRPIMLRSRMDLVRFGDVMEMWYPLGGEMGDVLRCSRIILEVFRDMLP
jgi:hypothetical protein